jgi:hypothetical protein
MCDDEKNDDLIIDIDDEDEELDDIDKEVMGIDFIED